ncbi:hypothetical protein GPECTOR_31g317 [Gonium pectorale]|uniref:Reverse transcriptase Ty1/copia-type domain-containing protein n=1 Tax=Gonium pectorale TaxID=33097 RepID=A0A150GEE8_GONPE|nr:hypothetical protein GPECTOR_31g317 [Gonium pectorale]|eukprot:KXZ47955.1 hypothetical protein GPECTOR_31g317 [Gonium pectorale]
MAAVAADQNLSLHQLDVMTAFLNGELEEEPYMQQPPGFNLDELHLVCCLHRSIYGLKQAPRCWYRKLVEQLGSLGYEPSAADAALFVRRTGDHTVPLLCHVMSPGSLPCAPYST